MDAGGRRRSVALAVVVLAGCASPLSSVRWPEASRYPDAPSLVLDDDMTVRFEPGPDSGRAEALVTRRSLVAILRPGGEGAAHIEVGYQRGLADLVAFSARTLGPDLKERVYDIKDASDLPDHPGFELYSSSRSLVLNAQPALPGTLVETTSVVRVRDPLLFPERQTFGNAVPSRRVRLEVITPEDWQIEWLARRLDQAAEFEPTVTVDRGARRYLWERLDVPAPPREALAPSRVSAFERVSVRLLRWDEQGAVRSGFADPPSLSRWLAAADRPAATLTPELRALALALVGDAADDETRARRLHAYVRDRVAYCAIEVGLGGWLPHPAADVARLGYGDSKDKANLLHVLLAAVGVPSRRATLFSHEGMPLPFGMPTLEGNTNHVIVVVDLPGGPRFLDPTSRTTSFDVLPDSDAGADILPIDGAGASLLRTPPARPDQNRLTIALHLQLSRSGGVAGRFSVDASGAPAARFRMGLLEAAGDDRRRRAAGWVDVRGARVVEVAARDVEPGEREHPVRLSGELVSDSGVGRAEGLLLVRPATILDAWLPHLPAGPRRLPVVLPGCQERTQSLWLSLPEGAQPGSLPAPVEVASPFGTYRLSFDAAPGELVVERRLTIKERLVEPADYAALLAWTSAVAAAEAQAAVIALPAATVQR